MSEKLCTECGRFPLHETWCSHYEPGEKAGTNSPGKAGERPPPQTELVVRQAIAGEFMRVIRQRRISQQALSRASGVDQAVISLMLAERRTPSIESLARLADALNHRIEFKLKLRWNRKAPDERQ
jgi:hypothetical protein